MRWWQVNGLKKIVLIILVSLLPTRMMAATAEEFVSYLPDGAITLELILAVGKGASDSYKLSQAPLAEKDIQLLQAQSIYNSKLELTGQYLDNRNEATSTVSPTSTSNNTYAAKLSKSFSTGTSLQAEISHGDSEINFAAFPQSKFVETAATVSLAQDLLKNSMGRSGRWLNQAGALSAKIKKQEAIENEMEWMKSFTELFYQAWQAQQRVIAAKQAEQGKQRLYNITALQVRRGTAESPDLLQVKRALDNARSNYLDSYALVKELWRRLIINLKIHQQDIGWLQVDPMKIPTKLDQPQLLAEELCRTHPLGRPYQRKSHSVILAQSRVDASQLLKKRSKDALNADLKFNLSLRANGVEVSDRGETVGEAFSAENPSWAVGLSYSTTWEKDKENSELAQSHANHLVNQTQYDLAFSDFTLNWSNDCSDLNRWIQRTGDLAKTLKEQNRRLRLEEQRFQLGRVPLLNVIQASDESTETLLNLNQAKVESRLAAWRIKRHAGESKKYLDQLKAPQLGPQAKSNEVTSE